MPKLTLLVRGFIIGLSIAAPVGPIGVLCIRRTLAEGRLTGFLSGLGAATADMLYGAVAAVSLTVIMDLLIDQAARLRIVGGIFLVYLGLLTLLAKPPTSASPLPSGENARVSVLGAYLSTFFLTITNPMIIIMFVGIFAGVSTGSAHCTLLKVAVSSMERLEAFNERLGSHGPLISNIVTSTPFTSGMIDWEDPDVSLDPSANPGWTV